MAGVWRWLSSCGRAFGLQFRKKQKGYEHLVKKFASSMPGYFRIYKVCGTCMCAYTWMEFDFNLLFIVSQNLVWAALPTFISLSSWDFLAWFDLWTYRAWYQWCGVISKKKKIKVCFSRIWYNSDLNLGSTIIGLLSPRFLKKKWRYCNWLCLSVTLSPKWVRKIHQTW